MPRNDKLASDACEAAWNYFTCPSAHPMKEKLKKRAVDFYCEMYMADVDEDEKINRMMAL